MSNSNHVDNNKLSTSLATKVKSNSIRSLSTTDIFIMTPFIVAFFAFLLLPFLYSLYMSFFKMTKFDINSLKFVGLENYKSVLSNPKTLFSLLITILYAVLVIPSTVIIALITGYGLFKIRSKFLKSSLRAFLLFPNIADLLAISVVWSLIYSQSSPLVKLLHMATSPLSNKWFALPSVALVVVLKGAGFAAFLVYISLMNMDKSIIEAAYLDGATEFQTFWNIILPQLKSIISFLVITGIVGAFSAFAEIYALTGGGPFEFVNGTAVGFTTTIGYYLYRLWEEAQFGKATAMSFILLLIVIAVTKIVYSLLPKENE